MDRANVVLNYTEVESKVRECTNDEPWGPTGPQMQELVQCSFSYEQFPEMMAMLWRRMLNEGKANYRRIYKSLLVLNYLLRNGSERVVSSAREHLYDLRTLENFQYVDEMGKDQGVNIRHRAKQTIEFVQDDARVREERKKAKKNKDKYVGVDANMSMGIRGSAPRYADRDDEPRRRSADAGSAKEPASDSEEEPPARPAKSPPSLSPTSDQQPSRPKPKIQVSKKVDLGAAADFARQAASKEPNSGTTASASAETCAQEESLFDLVASPPAARPATSNTGAELFDLFDSIETTPQTTCSTAGAADDGFTDFADFSNFNSLAASASVDLIQSTVVSPPVGSGAAAEDFGDFESAFGPTATQTAAPAQAVRPTSLLTGSGGEADDLFNSIMSSPMDSLSGVSSLTSVNPVQPSPTQSNAGLLGDLQCTTKSVPPMSPTFDQILVPQAAAPPAGGPAANPAPTPEPAKQPKLAELDDSWCKLTGNLNINLDNLLESKSEKPKPSMNQLASGFARK